MPAADNYTRLFEWLKAPGCVAALQLAGLVVSRILPIFLLTPVFGGQGVPAKLRITIALTFAVALAHTLFSPSRAVFAPPYLILLLCKELMLGLTLSVMLLVTFHAYTAFGGLVDRARGEGALTAYDPHTKQQQTPFSTFALLLAATLFLTLGGGRFLLKTLGASYVVAPPDALLPAGLTPGATVPLLFAAAGDMFSIAVRLAAPALLLTLLVDVVLALIGRAASQINLSILGITVKGGLVLMVLLVTLVVIVRGFEREAAIMLDRVHGLLLRGG